MATYHTILDRVCYILRHYFLTSEPLNMPASTPVFLLRHVSMYEDERKREEITSVR
jgi:hypothetical protein